MAAWRKASWEEGEDSVQAAGRPAPVSSFQVLDDLLRSLDDRQRLPALAGIVLAGHSGGAQLVQRYAVLNNVDGPLRRDGLALRYVIANPSSYLYLTNERPRPDGKGYAPYERGICPPTTSTSTAPTSCPPTRAARRNPGCSCATRRATSPPAGRRRRQPRAPPAGQDLRRRGPGLHAAGARPTCNTSSCSHRAAASRSRCTAPATKCAAWATTARTCSARNAAPRSCWAKARAGRTRPRPASRSSRAASSARPAPSRAPPK